MNTTATENRFVIRAKPDGAVDACYWMQTPYEDAGVQYHWATHPVGAAQFDDEDMAKSMVKVMHVDHANPEVVSLEQATEEHTMPPANFPFNVFAIETEYDSAEVEAA